jgi:hypothetical protein
MSDAYEKFAKDIYANVYFHAKDRMDHNHGKPVLIVSGESHFDAPLEKLSNLFKDAAKQEPAMAAAYAHIAAIETAIRLAGKENVVISFERDPDVVKKIIADAKKDYGSVENYFGDNLSIDGPMGFAFRYAYNQGLTIIGSDTGDKAALKRHNGDIIAASKDEGRYKEEIVALKELAATHKPRFVVHIGGVDHLATLAGYPYDKDPLKSEANNPFKQTYGQPVMIFAGDRDRSTSAGGEFFKNLNSIIQADAPGKMDDSDLNEIEDRIESFADKLAPPSTTAPFKPPQGPRFK